MLDKLKCKSVHHWRNFCPFVNFNTTIVHLISLFLTICTTKRTHIPRCSVWSRYLGKPWYFVKPEPSHVRPQTFCPNKVPRETMVPWIGQDGLFKPCKLCQTEHSPRASQTGFTKVPWNDIWSCHKYYHHYANIQWADRNMLLKSEPNAECRMRQIMEHIPWIPWSWEVQDSFLFFLFWYKPEKKEQPKTSKKTFGNGCFWGWALHWKHLTWVSYWWRVEDRLNSWAVDTGGRGGHFRSKKLQCRFCWFQSGIFWKKSAM